MIIKGIMIVEETMIKSTTMMAEGIIEEDHIEDIKSIQINLENISTIQKEIFITKEVRAVNEEAIRVNTHQVEVAREAKVEKAKKAAVVVLDLVQEVMEMQVISNTR